MNQETCTTKCCCICHRLNGILIALIGISFLLGTFNVVSHHTVHIIWPILLILLGLKNAFCQGKCKCCSAA